MTFDLSRWAEAWRWHCQAGGPDPAHRAAGEDMLAQMTTDAHYDEVTLHVGWRGHDEIRDMFRTAVGWSRGLFHTPLAVQASNGRYCIEWKMNGVGNSENGMIPPHENPFEVTGVSVGRYNPDGLVYYHADYWNVLDWMEQGAYFPAGKTTWFADVNAAMYR